MRLPRWSSQVLRRKDFASRPPSAQGPSAVTIRLATPSDDASLQRLAASDSSAAPDGRVLVAEVNRELWAALSLDDGALVADPFRPSAELSWLLLERARRLSRTERPRLTRRLRPVLS